jgi:hypothetical protein
VDDATTPGNPADLATEYPDDPSISDDAVIWRRIPLLAHLVVDQDGKKRPSSAAFNDSRDSPMSGAIATVVGDPWSLVRDQSHACAVIRLTAGQLRNVGQAICPDNKVVHPTHPPQGLGHVYIAGNKTTSAKKQLARNAEWEITPEQATERFGSSD